MDSSSPTVVRTGDDRSFGGQSFAVTRTQDWTKPVTARGFLFGFGFATAGTDTAAGTGHARLRPRYRDDSCRSADGYGVSA